MRGHHIGRQGFLQRSTHGAAVESAPSVGHHEGDEPVDAVVAAQHHGRLRDAGQVAESGLDHAELQPEAAQLDLVVDAAVEEDLALVGDADRIARAVEHRVGAVSAEGIGDELLGGELGAAEIAGGDAGAADQQLALGAGADDPHLLVDDIAGVVRDRQADGHRLVRRDLVDGRDDGRLGRPVGIEDLAARTAPALADGRRTGLATKDDDAQARNVLRHHGEQRRHGVEHGDAGLGHQGGQALDLAQHLRRGDPERRADEIGDEDLLQREIEGDRSALEGDVVRRHAVDEVRRAQIVADIAVGDDDALGLAGRARGVDRIGRARRRHAIGARVDRRGTRAHGDQIAAAHGVGRQLPIELGAGGIVDDKDLRRAIGEAFADALRGRVGIERNIGRAGLEDAEQRDMQVERAGHPQADEIASRDAARPQRPRHLVGPCIELGVSDALGAENDGDAVGRAPGGGLEDLAEQFITQERRLHGTHEFPGTAPDDGVHDPLPPKPNAARTSGPCKTEIC